MSTITVFLALDYCPNSAYFDDVTLLQEPVQTYDYDSDGNLVSATNSEGQTSTEYDEDDRLRKYTTMSGVQYDLTYSGTSRNPLTITSDSVRNTYSYDAAGNLQQTITRQSNNNGIYLQTNATYDSTKNYPASATDSSGTTTYTTYDSSKGLLTGSTNAHNVETHYSYYPNNDRSKACYQTNIAALTYSYYDSVAANGADHGRLLQINRKGKNYASAQPDFWQAYSFVYDPWGNVLNVKVGKRTSDTDTNITNDLSLVSNEYDSDSRLTKMTYPGNESIKYDYDLFDRCIHEVYNSAGGSVQAEHFYVYSADGQLARQYAKVGGAITESYSFEYDSLGRLIRSREENGSSTVQRTQHLYDTASRLTEQDWVVGSTAYSENYTYNSSDGSLSTFKVTANPDNPSRRSWDTLSFAYDSLKRVQQITDTETTPEHSNQQRYTRNYTYQPYSSSGTRTTNRIKEYKVKDSNNKIITGNAYTYDASGNITKINEVFTVSGTEYSRTIAEYTYDALDQLTKETRYSYIGNSTSNPASVEIYYNSDTAGNLRSVSGERNITYTYDQNWADKLTAITVGSVTKPINYASGGNPSNWYNGAEYTNLTWTRGRMLSSLTKGTSNNYSFSYDMNGIRTSKIANGKKHEYVTQNGKVVRETVTDASTGVFEYALDFTYDESGNPLTMRRYSNANMTGYYTMHYICNLQGDVVKLVGEENEVFATYTYDAWGNVLSAVENGSYDYAAINPLRYRGYYYDTETGWYYLQSRYYDPALGRFINADSYASTGQGFLGCNMFAYCNNNPVNYLDYDGCHPLWVLLFVLHRFGFIHECVAAHIIATNPTRSLEKERWLVGMTYRADIVDTTDGLVWEIKPDTGGIEQASTKARDQLEKYLGLTTVRDNTKLNNPGEAGAFQGSFYICAAGDYYLITYETPSEGAVIYHVSCEQRELDSALEVYYLKPIVKPHSAQTRTVLTRTPTTAIITHPALWGIGACFGAALAYSIAGGGGVGRNVLHLQMS